jgi:hypothetical protein
LDIALFGERGYCRAGSGQASCAKGILAPEYSTEVAVLTSNLTFTALYSAHSVVQYVQLRLSLVYCWLFSRGLCMFMTQLQTRIFLIPVPSIWVFPIQQYRRHDVSMDCYRETASASYFSYPKDINGYKERQDRRGTVYETTRTCVRLNSGTETRA